MAKKFSVWWSEWKFYVLPLLQLLSNLTFYGCGWRLSTPEDSMPFARAGALATAVSIGFTLWRYSAILARGNHEAKTKFNRLLDNANFPHVDIEAAKRNFGKKLDHNTVRIERVITISGVGLLIIATLVWGFGDLLKGYL